MLQIGNATNSGLIPMPTQVQTGLLATISKAVPYLVRQPIHAATPSVRTGLQACWRAPACVRAFVCAVMEGEGTHYAVNNRCLDGVQAVCLVSLSHILGVAVTCSGLRS